MNCSIINRDLFNYANGKLDDLQRKVVSDHLDSCMTCRDFAAKLKESLEILEEEKSIAPDPFLLTRIMAHTGVTEMQIRLARRHRIWQPLMAAAFILSMLLAGIHIGRNYQYHQALTDDYTTEVYYLSDVHDNLTESLLSTDLTNP